jgi:CBS domain-containing protein
MDRIVQDVMTTDLVTVDISDSAQEAARRMLENGTGDVLVTEAGALRGIVTDRDLAVRLVAEGRDASTPVRELVSAGLVSCPPQASLQQAVQMMKENDVRRVPVVDGDRPVGVLSIGDLALLADSGDLLRDISMAPDSETGQG